MLISSYVSVSLDLDARLEVIISSGREDITDVVLNLSEADEAIKFDLSMASFVDPQCRSAGTLIRSLRSMLITIFARRWQNRKDGWRHAADWAH